jgi:hypothetical protein
MEYVCELLCPGPIWWYDCVMIGGACLSGLKASGFNVLL